MAKSSIAFAIASFFLLAALGSAQAQSKEEQIKKLEIDRAAAVVKGDLATLEKGTSDDYSLINVNGQMSDKSQMVNSIKSGSIKLTTDDLSDLKVRLYGNTAVVTGKANVQGQIGGKDINGQVMFTRVWVKKNGTWQSVAFQQTAVSNP